MSLTSEFREFAIRGSFIDMAVGIIVGAAVGKVVNSLVNDMIMPVVGMLLGRVDLREFQIALKEKVMGADGATVVDPGVYVRVGQFANTLLEFFIITFCIFLMLKVINRARALAPAPAAKP